MEPNNMQAVIDAARSGRAVEMVSGNSTTAIYNVPTKDGAKLERVNIESGLPAPLRKRGAVTVFDVASLKQIMADNADAGHAVVYLDRDVDTPACVAVLNGNGPGSAGWGDMTVSMAFRWTAEWLKWKSNDGKLLDQTAFAEFIEDNLDDISSPPGAEMLEIAQYLQATRTVNFKSRINLSNGQVRFENNEDLQAQVKAGDVAVPATFTLGIAPLFGMPAFSVPARFRWRLDNGKLRLGYKLQRVESLMATIMDKIEAALVDGSPIEVVHGVVPAATK